MRRTVERCPEREHGHVFFFFSLSFSFVDENGQQREPTLEKLALSTRWKLIAARQLITVAS